MGSINEEITRIENAKSDIETAIEECGVDVPDNNLIDTYGNYIRQIPSAVFSDLNVNEIGGSDKYIESIKQTSGKIEATLGGLASTETSGLMSASDKIKLNGLQQEYSYLYNIYSISPGEGTKYYKLLSITPTSTAHGDMHYEFDVAGRNNIRGSIKIFIRTTYNKKYISTISIKYSGNIGNNVKAYKYRDETSETDTVELWMKVVSYDTLKIFPKTHYVYSDLPVIWSAFTASTQFPTDFTEEITISEDTYYLPSHTHSYLPLAGGTLTDSIKILNEKPIFFKTERAKESGGGWSRNFIVHYKNDDTALGYFGMYGRSCDPFYMYLGFNNFNEEKNLRISPESVSWGSKPILHTDNYNNYAPKLDGTGAFGTWGINITGSATTASYLPEARLTWGGRNFASSWGPIDAAMIPELGANRFEYYPGSKIKIEYSTNNGSTWTDSALADTTKSQIFSSGYSIYLGGSNATKIDKSQYQTRITLTTASTLYSTLNKFAIRVSTSGSSDCWCSIDVRLQSNVESNTNTWVNVANKVAVSGWSGWNIINTNGFTTYGNQNTSQYGEIRFTFGATHPSSSEYPGLIISRIKGFGGEGWTTPSNKALTGTIYTEQYDQSTMWPNTLYPASTKTISLGTSTRYWNNIYGTTIYENGTSLASKYQAKGSYAKTNSAPTTAVGIASVNDTGIYYVNGTSDILNQADGALITSKYNDSWISQIYQDYRTGKIALRGKNNGTWTTWLKPSYEGHTHTNITLQGYTKPLTTSEILQTDTLNQAIGKLEYKTDIAYNWINSVTGDDTDTIVNKWEEIVNFLDSVNETLDITEAFVTTTTTQTIRGLKTFAENIIITNSSENTPYIRFQRNNIDDDYYDYYIVGETNGLKFKYSSTDNIPNEMVSILPSGITATAFKTTGGSSSLFVKGDGSLDTNQYATKEFFVNTLNNKLNNYLPLAGGIMAGTITLGGQNSSSPESSTSQILFGASGAKMTSNGNGNVVINPNSGTTGQIILTPGSSPLITVGGKKVLKEDDLSMEQYPNNAGFKITLLGTDYEYLSPTFNDINVEQVATTSANVDRKPLLLGHENINSDSNEYTGGCIGSSYASHNIFVLPSTGTLFTNYLTTGNLTTNSIVFTTGGSGRYIISYADNLLSDFTIMLPLVRGAGRLAFIQHNTTTNTSTAAGSLTKPVWVNAQGHISECTYSLNANVNATVNAAVNAAVNIGTKGKLVYYSETNSLNNYTGTVGASNKPIYFNNGIPTAISLTASTNAILVMGYLNGGMHYGSSVTIQNGNSLYASGGFYESSDNRLKNFISDIDVDLEKLSLLPKKYFTWKSDESNNLNIGTSAQELQKLYPELVKEDEKGMLNVAYDKLSIIALKAIDKLYKKIKDLENEINNLNNGNI